MCSELSARHRFSFRFVSFSIRLNETFARNVYSRRFSFECDHAYGPQLVMHAVASCLHGSLSPPESRRRLSVILISTDRVRRPDTAIGRFRPSVFM